MITTPSPSGYALALGWLSTINPWLLCYNFNTVMISSYYIRELTTFYGTLCHVQGSTPCHTAEIVHKSHPYTLLHTPMHAHPPNPLTLTLHLMQVVCRQLGYAGANQTSSFREYPAGTGTIWMDNVRCIGNESSLASCPFNGWAVHNCAHVEDAGVVCSGRRTCMISYLFWEVTQC